jgi:hypothetical protein
VLQSKTTSEKNEFHFDSWRRLRRRHVTCTTIPHWHTAFRPNHPRRWGPLATYPSASRILYSPSPFSLLCLRQSSAGRGATGSSSREAGEKAAADAARDDVELRLRPREGRIPNGSHLLLVLPVVALRPTADAAAPTPAAPARTPPSPSPRREQQQQRRRCRRG